MSDHKLPLRAELPGQLTWDLSPVYTSAEAWDADFAKIAGLIEKVQAFRGKLAVSPATLRDAFAAVDDLERLAEKLYVYAHLRHDENTADGANSARKGRISARFAEISAACAWFEPEVLALNDATSSKFLDSPELAFYRRSLSRLLESREHILSTAEETVLGSLADVLGSPDQIYGILNDADLAFPKVADDSGKKTELTHGNYIKFLESADRGVRRRAFKAMFSTYGKFRNTFAATLDGAVKCHAVDARLRRYPSALAAALFPDRVPEQVYTGLISAVRANLAPMFRYIELRRKALKLRNINMYDLHCPLRPACRAEYSWDEAKSTVRSALAPMGPEYLAALDRAFSERWIDVPECRGKRSGAYSGGSFDTPPYMLLNFHGTLNDVFTLAHELGHSMHSHYSNLSQQYHYADYSIFVAEVASTTNEILLQRHLMDHCNSRELKIHLISHLLDEIRGTVYRQTMFAEFELLVHRLAEQGTPLTADLLDEEYSKLNAAYYGPGLQADELIRHEWARIPHFYYDFYVYKYATGMSAAMMLAENLLSGDPAKHDAYFSFLKAGSSRDVLDIMKSAGADLATPAPVEACLAVFDRLVAELERLLA